MLPSLRRLALRAAVLYLFVYGCLLYAQHIDSISGSISSFTLTSPDPSSGTRALLQFSGITTSLGNTTGQYPTSFGRFDISRTPVAGQAGYTTFTVGPADTQGTVKVIGGLPGGSASFDLSGLVAAVSTDPALSNTMVITGKESLSTNSSSLDFTDFSQGTVTLTFQAPTGYDLADLIINGSQRRGIAIGSGAFTQLATGTSPPPSPTCEQNLAQQLAVSGLDPKLTITYPLSSPVIPAFGYATSDMSAAIDAAVGNFMNQNGMPGAVIAMTYNNQLIFAKSYGYIDVDNGLFAEPDSRLRVASISKAITAMGILKLVHDSPPSFPVAGGLLNDQPFAPPAFGTPIGGSLQSWIAPITVNELLYHAGGWAEDYENYDNLTAVEQLPGQNSSAPPSCLTLLQYLESRPMTSFDATPGTKFLYSNVGFCALSEVIRTFGSAASYSNYIQNNVFAPLGMNDTALGLTPISGQQDREGVYYPCGNSPLQGLPSVGVPCAYFSSGFLVKGGPDIGGPSLFAPHDNVSPAYGGGVHAFSLEASEGAGGFVSTSIDLAHFTGAIASGKLPNFQGGTAYPGWPQKFYTYSTGVPPYPYSSSAWVGMGWDTIQPNAVPIPFLSYDNFNFIKGGGLPGTTSEMAATANGYGFAAIFNGDTGADLDPVGAILWSNALPAAVAHAQSQPWTIDFTPQYSQPYTGWMSEGDFVAYASQQQAGGLYPSRLEGRAVTTNRRGTLQSEYEFRGRFGSSSTAAQYVYGQSCSAVLSAIKAAPVATPLVSLQRFLDPSSATNVYQAVWAAPITQLPGSASPLSISTTSLPNGVVGASYSQYLMAVGGKPPYTWRIISGRLPAGLTLNSATGLISGTPTSPTSGMMTFQVTDSSVPTLSATVTLVISIGSNP